jgi:hypothetical protein
MKTPDEEKPLYKKGYARAKQEADTTMRALNATTNAIELAEQVGKLEADNIAKVSQMEREVSRAVREARQTKEDAWAGRYGGDPYAYWSQFREEPNRMIEELAAMALELKLDDLFVLVITRGLLKQVQQQRKALASAAGT